MEVDIYFRYILLFLFFSAPVLFLKVMSEILVAEKAKTKTSQLGHIAPWPVHFMGPHQNVFGKV